MSNGLKEIVDLSMIFKQYGFEMGKIEGIINPMNYFRKKPIKKMFPKINILDMRTLDTVGFILCFPINKIGTKYSGSLYIDKNENDLHQVFPNSFSDKSIKRVLEELSLIYNKGVK